MTGLARAVAQYVKARRELERAQRRMRVEWSGCPGVCLSRPECRARQSCQVAPDSGSRVVEGDQ